MTTERHVAARPPHLILTPVRHLHRGDVLYHEVKSVMRELGTVTHTHMQRDGWIRLTLDSGITFRYKTYHSFWVRQKTDKYRGNNR